MRMSMNFMNHDKIILASPAATMSPDLEDAVIAFNAAVHGVILSWMPGKKRLHIHGLRQKDKTS